MNLADLYVERAVVATITRGICVTDRLCTAHFTHAYIVRQAQYCVSTIAYITHYTVVATAFHGSYS